MLWGQSCHVHRSRLYCSQKTYIPKLSIKIQLLLWHNFGRYSNLYHNWHGLIYSCWKPSLCYVSPDRLFHLYLRSVMYAIVMYRKMQKQPLQNLFKLNSECILFVFWESRHNEPVCTKSVYFLDLLRRINCHLVRNGKIWRLSSKRPTPGTMCAILSGFIHESQAPQDTLWWISSRPVSNDIHDT